MANLSNINNKFIVTDGGNILIGQTSAVGSSIFQVTGNSTFTGKVITTQVEGPSSLRCNSTAGNLFLDSTSDIILRTTSSNTPALTIDTSQNATFGGNVNIEGNNVIFKNVSSSNRCAILTNETDTGTGIMRIQAGGISGAYGGGITLYANDHDGKAGDVVAGLSSGANGAKFRVNLNGVDTSTDVFTVDRSGNGNFVGNVIGKSIVVGPAGNLNDTTGVSGTLQFGNGNTAFVTGSADAYIYKNQSALGSLPVGSLTFQLRSDTTGGAFAFVGQQTAIPLLTIDSSGDSTFAGNVLMSEGELTLNKTAGTFVQFKTNNTAIGYIGDAQRIITNGAASSFAINAQSNFIISTGGATERMRIDNSGHVGIGITPQTTLADFCSIELGNTGMINSEKADSQYNSLFLSNNAYYTDVWRYKTASVVGANYISLYRGEIVFATAPAPATAGDAITWSSKMTLSNDGNVGIGETSPTTGKLVVKGSPYVITDSGRAFGGIDLRTTTNAGNGLYSAGISFGGSATASAAISGIQQNTDGDVQGLAFFTHASASSTADTAERMRITSGGDILFGTEGIPNGTSIYGAAFGPASSGVKPLFFGTASTSAKAAIVFSNPNGIVGDIRTSGTATIYLTASDYRLKEDLQDFAGLDMVSKIPVYDFKWKTDESRSYGVMAHELQEVLPDAVVGDKDAEEMQGVDYSKIVPLLVKSIQELKAEVEELKSKPCNCNNCNCNK